MKQNLKTQRLYLVSLVIAGLAAAGPLQAASSAPATSTEGKQAISQTGKQDHNPAHFGLVSERPTWGVGLQAGSFSNTGITAQKSGFANGALNMTFGLGLWSPVLIFDYVRFYTDSFRPYAVKDAEGVAASRGLLLPYLAFGAQAGRGVGLRFSAGAQYTMLEDPVNVFAGATVLVGPCKCDSYLMSTGTVGLGISLGVRVML